MEWQPIETAPKDRRILALTDEKTVVIVEWAVFSEKEPCFDDVWGGYEFRRDGELTDWMPVPDPPVRT